MNSHTVQIVYIGCFIMGTLLGILRGYIAQQSRKLRDEKRELLKWQLDLEKRASEIRKK